MALLGAKELRLRVARVLPRRRPAWPLLATAALVAMLSLLPLYYLFARALDGGSETWDLVFRARTAQVLVRTAVLIAFVTLFSALVAVPLAWLTARTDMPLKRLFTVAAVLPLVVPSFVMATVLIEFFGAGGVLAVWLGAFGLGRMPGISGLPGATMALVLLTYPYVFLTVRAALLRADPALEEASRSMGYGSAATFRMVTLPILKPAMAAGGLLTALYTLSDFGAVALMRYETFTFAIFNQYESALNRSVAAGLSLVLVFFAVALLTGEGLTRGRARYHRSTSGTARVGRVARLGAWRWPWLMLASLPVLVGLVIPVGVLGWWLARGLGAGQTMTALFEPARNSIFVSLSAALITVAAALPIAIVAARYRDWWASRLIERSTYIGFGLPGVVVAISLVFFGVNYARPAYQTNWLLLFGYAVLFLPVAVGAVKASMLQISPHVEEAAQGLGRAPWRVLISVTLPLVAPGVLAAAALVFLLTMKELPATLILSPIGFQTLATVIWDASVDAFFAKTAAASLLLILVAGVPTAFMLLRDRSYRSGEV